MCQRLCMQEDGKPRFTPADLQSHLSPMFENLFLAFQKPESGENEYLMKCVMRVITLVGQEVNGRPSTFCQNCHNALCTLRTIPVYKTAGISWAERPLSHFF